MPHPPAGVGPFDDGHPALSVALIRVIVAGEEIALIVEGQFLRIAQPAMDHLQLRTIRFTAKHRPFVGQIDHRALLRHHVGTAIAAGEVQAPIRSENEPMQVVTREAETHSEPVQNRPRLQRLRMHLGLGLQRGLLGFRQVAPNRTGRPDVPQRRNLGEPHLPLAGQHTTANAAEGAGEVFCHDLGVVSPSIVIGIL